MADIEDGSLNMTYPLMLNPLTFDLYVFPLFFGGMTLSNQSTIEVARALSISYWIRTNTPEEDLKYARTGGWEEGKRMDCQCNVSFSTEP